MMRKLLMVLVAASGILLWPEAGAFGQVAPAVNSGKTSTGVAYLQVSIPTAQTQSLQLLWKDASPQAPGAKPGLPLAVSYLMSREPKGEVLGELIETLKDYQAGFNFSVGTDAAGLSISAPREHFTTAVMLIKRFLDDPALPDDRLDTFRHDVALRARQSLRLGQTLAGQLRMRALLPDGALRRYHLTDPNKLEGVRAADVEAWRRTLARDRLLIVTAGPLTPAEFDAPLSRLVDQLPATAAKVEPPMWLPLRSFSRTIMLEAPVPQTIIQAFGSTAVEPGLDSIKASIALARLGGGAQGRLHAALRDAIGATYGVSAGLETVNWSTVGVNLSTAVQHDKAAEALAALRREYALWWNEGVTEAEFAAVRSGMLGGRRAARSNPGSVAIGLVNAVARGMPQDYFKAYDAALESITREEVNAYIKARFPSSLGVVIVGPRNEALTADCTLQRLDDAARCGL